jgi:hypothetical protein
MHTPSARVPPPNRRPAGSFCGADGLALEPTTAIVVCIRVVLLSSVLREIRMAYARLATDVAASQGTIKLVFGMPCFRRDPFGR